MVGRLAKVAQVFRQVPEQLLFIADGPVSRKVGDQRDNHAYLLRKALSLRIDSVRAIERQ